MDNKNKNESKLTFDEWVKYLTAGYQSNIEVDFKYPHRDCKEINVYVKHPKTRELVHVYGESF